MIKKIFQAQIISFLGIISLAILMFAGFYLLFSPSFNYWPNFFRTVFVLIIFGYVIYRSMNIYHHYKSKEDKQ